MAARPITGWVFAPRGPTSWQTLDAAFLAGRASAPSLDAALEAARDRWGRTRLACLTHREGWSNELDALQLELTYSKLGPCADVELLGSASALLEGDLADAVLLRSVASSLHCALLIERAGRSGLQLRRGARREADLVARPKPGGFIGALVVASAAIEGGIACGDGGVEPDRVHVANAASDWTVEVRE